jgi:hypothetical protein
MFIFHIVNIRYPERVIHTVTGVTALDFSSRIPNLLAVGLQDGTVAIYNMKREGADLEVPILDSSSLSSKDITHMKVQIVLQVFFFRPEHLCCFFFF